MTEPADFPVALIEPMLHAVKTAARWSGWQQRNNHAGHMLGVAKLVDAGGITMPGLTVQLEIKAPVVAVSCFYLFSIMRLAGRERRPVYQLEVVPHGKRSHNGLLPLYGPHEHVGALEPVGIDHASVNCDDWDACLTWFFIRTSIVPFDPSNPMVLQ